MKRLTTCQDCSRPTTNGTRCTQCAPAVEQERNELHNQRNPHYRTYAWKKARDLAVATNHGVCATCSSADRLHVHHIDHVADGTHDTQDNLMPLCYGCHGQLEREYANGDTDGTMHRALQVVIDARKAAGGE